MKEVISGVYFIKNKNNGNIKIGCSNNINKRYETLCSQMVTLGGCKEDLVLIDYVACNDYFEFENYLHRKYYNFRLNGEWFNVDINNPHNDYIRYKVGNINIDDIICSFISKLYKNYSDKFKAIIIGERLIPTYKDLSNVLNINEENIKNILNELKDMEILKFEEIQCYNGLRVFISLNTIN